VHVWFNLFWRKRIAFTLRKVLWGEIVLLPVKIPKYMHIRGQITKYMHIRGQFMK